VSAIVSRDNVRVVIHPELSVSEKRDGRLSCPEIFAVFRDEQMQTLKQVTVNVIDDAGRTIIGIWPRLSVRLADRDAPTIMVDGHFSESCSWPRIRHFPSLPRVALE